MASSVENLKYHIVWATKYRYSLICNGMVGYLRSYFESKQKPWKFKIRSLAIEPNHIHILIEANNSSVNINDLIRKLKGGSSLILRNKFRKLMRYPSVWTASHFCSTIGNVSEDTVKTYVESQGIEETEVIQRTNVYKIFPSKVKLKRLSRYLEGVKNEDSTLAPAAMIQNKDRVAEGQIPLRNDLIKYSFRETKSCSKWLKVNGGKSCGTKPFWLGLLGRGIPEDATIRDSYIQYKDGQFKVYLVYEQKRTIKRASIEGARLNIDLGISHPVTSVAIGKEGKTESVSFLGKGLKNLLFRRRKYVEKLQELGSKYGTEPNYQRRLARYTNRINDYIHKMTKDLVDTGLPIIVGSIRNINRKWRRGKCSKDLRKRAMNIAYGKISEQLRYKGAIAGIPIVFVDEFNTSVTCSSCGNKDKSQRKEIGRASCRERV